MKIQERLFTVNNKKQHKECLISITYVIEKSQALQVLLLQPVADITNCSGGTKEITIPRYMTIEEAIAENPDADVLVNFASERSCAESTMDALNTDNIRTIIMIAEGVPQRDVRKIAKIAKEKRKWIIGPATVGGIKPGCFKIGNAAGTVDNIKDTKIIQTGFCGFRFCIRRTFK